MSNYGVDVVTDDAISCRMRIDLRRVRLSATFLAPETKTATQLASEC